MLLCTDAGQAHREIEASWTDAYETAMPLPNVGPDPKASSSSSSANIASSSSAAAPAATTTPLIPWKDDKGYCFLPAPDKPHGRYLGRNPGPYRTV